MAATALILAVPAAAPVAASGDRIVGRTQGPTRVAGYRDVLAWSKYDGGRRVFRLVLRVGTRTQIPRIAGRRRPFDVNLGPGPGGHIVAAYSRCTAAYDNGCRLYAYDLSTEREAPILATHVAGDSEYLPSVWRRRVAYIRLPTHERPVRRIVPHIYVQTIGRHDAEQLAGGARGDMGSVRLRGRIVVDNGPGPTALDLRGRMVSFAWTVAPRACNGDTEGSLPVDLQLSQLWLATGASPHRQRLVDTACTGDPVAFVDTPTLTPTSIDYYRVLQATGAGCSVCAASYDLRDRTVRMRALPGGGAGSVAPLASGRIGYATQIPGRDGPESIVAVGRAL